MNTLWRQFRIDRVTRNLLWVGLWTLGLATLWGNALITGGHILLVLGMLLQIGLLVANRESSVHVTPRRWSISSWLLVSYTAVCMLSILSHWADYDNPIDALKKLRYEAITLSLLFVTGCVDLVWMKRFKTVTLLCVGSAAWMICLAAVISWVTGVHPLTGDPLWYGRAGGVSGTVMSFAYSLPFFILPMVGLLLCKSQQRSWFDDSFSTKYSVPILGLILLTVLAAFYLSGSRGALAGVAVGFLTLLVVLRNRWAWVMVVSAGVLFLILAWQVDSRFLIVSDPIRAKIWKTALLTTLEHPVLGIGYRQLEEQSHLLAQQFGIPPIEHPYISYEYAKTHAHNNYLEAFAGTGFLGGTLFCGFCVAWLIESTRSRFLQLFVLPGVISFGVSGMFESTFIDSETKNIIMLLYLLTQIILRKGSEADSTET